MQAHLALAMGVSMVSFIVCWALLWVDGGSDLLLVLSAAGVGLSTGLYLLAGAVLPDAERGQWRVPKCGLPRAGPPRPSVEMGRLVFLGAGIWFTNGGLVFLAVVLLDFPEDGFPVPLVAAILVTAAVGLGIFFIGLRCDQRRFDAVRGVPESQPTAATRP